MKTRIATLAVVLFVMGIFVSTSAAAIMNPKADCSIGVDSQPQAQEMKCGESGCGEKKECDKSGSCDKKKECQKGDGDGCPKGKDAGKGCQKGGSCKK